MRYSDPEAQAEIDRLTASLASAHALAALWQAEDGRTWIANCGDDLAEVLRSGKIEQP